VTAILLDVVPVREVNLIDFLNSHEDEESVHIVRKGIPRVIQRGNLWRLHSFCTSRDNSFHVGWLVRV